VEERRVLHAVTVFDGLEPHGFVLLNSTRTLHDLGVEDVAHRLPQGHARTVGASELARAELGKPLPNAALLGALAALTRIVSIESVVRAIEQRFGGRARAGNAAAARAAHHAIGEGPC
jgi:pyruvate ferredoxin oxidoreductase gamma subunit